MWKLVMLCLLLNFSAQAENTVCVKSKCVSLPDRIKSVSVMGDQLIVDGIPIDLDKDFPKTTHLEVTVNITGNVEEIKDVDTVSVSGDAGNIDTVNGNVSVTGSVNKDVQTTNGDVSAHSIIGSVDSTNGNISCGRVNK